jgi:hypothetical protein
MKGKLPNQEQLQFFSQPLENFLNPKNSLYQLTHKIPWEELEVSFSKYYSARGMAG